MCESTVYMERAGAATRELVMEDVVRVAAEGERIKLTGILGETCEVTGRIAEIDLIRHTITLEQGA
ncbi:MAG: CooT family nickel-binding protein [Methanomicrobia archaeon]|nr:CooT family nickel-binding protein [Methanomicrobia archaeon]